MECKTVKDFNEDGTPIIVNKVKYDSMSDAQENADRINNKSKILIKRVAYQCSQCHKYHVGSSYEMLENKTLPKPAKMGGSYRKPKVVGQVDIDIVNAAFKEKEKKKLPKEPKLGREPKPDVRTVDITGVEFNLMIGDGPWSYCAKKKVVDIRMPDGTLKKPSMEKVYGKEALEPGFFPYKGPVTRYIKLCIIREMSVEEMHAQLQPKPKEEKPLDHNTMLKIIDNVNRKKAEVKAPKKDKPYKVKKQLLSKRQKNAPRLKFKGKVKHAKVIDDDNYIIIKGQKFEL